MASNLESLGFDVDDQVALEQLLSQLSLEAQADVLVRSRHEHRRWTDPSGASIAFHLGHGAIQCITPFFTAPEGSARWRVATRAAVRDGECLHCSGADCDLLDGAGEVVSRCAVQWLHFEPYERWLGEERRFELEVVAFAHRARFFDGTEAFEAAQRAEFGDEPAGPTGKPLRLAHNAFVPTGLFGNGSELGARATAIVCGTVARHERLTNSRSGAAFERVRIDALPGPLDVVFREGEGGARPGAFGWFEAWLVGRPVEPPPEARGFWGRLFAR